MTMRATALVAALAALLIGPATGLGVPTLSDPVAVPYDLESDAGRPARSGVQNDFGSGLPGPAVVQVNPLPTDGSGSGAWQTIAIIARAAPDRHERGRFP